MMTSIKLGAMGAAALVLAGCSVPYPQPAAQQPVAVVPKPIVAQPVAQAAVTQQGTVEEVVEKPKSRFRHTPRNTNVDDVFSDDSDGGWG